MKHGWRFLLVPVAFTVVLTSILMARTAVVTMNNGTRIEGEVVEDTPDAVILESRGIRTTIQRGDIQSIEDRVPFEQELADRRAKLPAGDVKARLELARWCFDQRHYDEAKALAQEAVKIDPNSVEAGEMEELIRRQVSMEQRSGETTAPTGPVDIHATPASVDRNFVSDGDINLIKNVEVTDGEKITPRFLNDVKKRYLEQSGADAKDFGKLSPLQQFQKIRDTKDPALLRDLSITGDPVRISQYRQKVQPILLSGCAGAGCHGTMAGKGFVVFISANGSEPATYSNLYILMQYKRMLQSEGSGLFEGGMVQRKMINRQTPEQSLLLEYGLPRGSATFKHPQVNGLTPIFRDKNDPKYQTVLAWIRSLGPVDPNYRIDYTPPRAPEDAATQPAEVPETQAAPAPAKAP